MICFALNRPLRWLGSCTWLWPVSISFSTSNQYTFVRCNDLLVCPEVSRDPLSPLHARWAVSCLFVNHEPLVKECSKWYVKARLHSEDASPYPSNPGCHLLKLEPCMCLLHVQKSRFKIKETRVTFQKTLIYLKPVPNTRAELKIINITD